MVDQGAAERAQTGAGPDVLRALFNTTDTLLAYLDGEFSFVEVNDAYVRSSGHTREELLGQSHFRLFPDAENEQIFRRVRETGEPAHFQARPFEYADQPWRGVTYWDWTLKPLQDSSGGVQGLLLSLADATERERAERARRDAEARTSAIVTTAVDGIVTIDQRGTIEWANPACGRMFGYSLEELTGSDISMLMPSPEREEHARYLARYLETGQARVIGTGRQVTGRRRDGSLFPIDLAVSEVLLGGCRHFAGIMRDVSERVRMEEAFRAALAEARESRSVVDALLANTPIGIAFFDRQGRYVHINQALADINGLPSEAHVGRTPAEVVPDLWPRTEAVLRRILAGEDLVRFEVRGETVAAPGVERRWLETWYPVRTAGEVIGVGGIIEDVTDRRRAEEVLAASEERYRTVAETLPAIVTVNHPDGEPEFCNQRWYDYTGMTFEQLLSWSEQELVHADDLGRTVGRWQEAIATGEAFENEVRLRRRDGIYRWHLVRALPIRTADGAINRWMSISIDIQDRKDAEDGRERLLAEVRRAAAAKDEFLGLVSHELRTPITTIFGNAKMLRNRGGALDEQTRAQAITDIEEEADRLKRIVDNMLVLARAEAGPRIGPEPVLLPHLVQAVVREHRQRWPHRRIEVSVEPGTPPAEGVPSYIEQVLRNLLSNAEKYSPRKQPIDVRASGQDGEVQVLILDRGGGIAPEETALVFTAFYRSQATADASSGAGIGLAVCKLLVESQGGRLWARAREGGGSEFGFSLPACEEPPV